MNYSAISKIKEILRNGEQENHFEVPEMELFRNMLELAIEDLNSNDLTRRRRAQWWIFRDESEGLDPSMGYISFHTACEVLGIKPDSARAALRDPIRQNGLKGKAARQGARPKRTDDSPPSQYTHRDPVRSVVNR